MARGRGGEESEGLLAVSTAGQKIGFDTFIAIESELSAAQKADREMREDYFRAHFQSTGDLNRDLATYSNMAAELCNELIDDIDRGNYSRASDSINNLYKDYGVRVLSKALRIVQKEEEAAASDLQAELLLPIECLVACEEALGEGIDEKAKACLGTAVSAFENIALSISAAISDSHAS
jgi:hypothetical protein